MPPMPRKPGRTLLDDVAHPVQRLHVVFEGGAAEEPDLSDIGRTEARFTPLAFDRLDHGRLFTADVRARAAAKMKLGNPARGIRAKRGQLALEDGAATVVLVTEIDVDGVDPDDPRRDNRTLEKTMWIALQVVAVLEGAGLSFDDVDRHQARRRFRSDDLPFAAGREAGAAEAAQPRGFHRRDDLSGRAFPFLAQGGH